MGERPIRVRWGQALVGLKRVDGVWPVEPPFGFLLPFQAFQPAVPFRQRMGWGLIVPCLKAGKRPLCGAEKKISSSRTLILGLRALFFRSAAA